MLDIRVTEEGAALAIEDFEMVATRGMDFSPAQEAIHAVLIRAEELQYRYGGRRGEHRWAPLSKEWIQYKRDHGFRVAKGIMSGDVMNSLINASDQQHVFEATRNQVIFGSEDPKFALLQDENADRNHPYRPPIDLTITDVRALVRTVEDWVIGRQRF